MNGAITFSGSNSFGSLNVAAGARAIAAYPNLTAFGGGGPLVASGSAQVNGNSLTVANLTGGAAGVVENGPSAFLPALFAVGTDNTSTTYSGIFSDGNATYPLSVTKTGSGMLTIAGAKSSFTGNLAVNGGTLQVGAANNVANPATTPLGNTQLATRTITVDGGGVLQLTQGNTMGGANASGDGVLTPIVINAGGLVTSNANINNIIGPVVLSGGTLAGLDGVNASYYTYQLSGGSISVDTAPSVMTASGNYAGFNMAAVTTFNVAATDGPGPDLIVSAPLGDVQNNLGSASLVKIGSGLMQLAASSTYTGSTTIDGGTLQLGTGIAGQDGSIANTNGVTDDGALIFNIAGTQTAAYNIGGSGSLFTIGSGTLTLSGMNNTYTGGTYVEGAGSLIVTNPAAIDANGVGTNLFVGNDLEAFGTIQPANSAIVSAAGAAAVPEPGTMALIAAATAVLAFRLRRRNRTCILAPVSRN
jgi:autotransporter-associated beta strand protein